MSIKNKILVIILVVLTASGVLITSIWYKSCSDMVDKYLADISESTMQDAYQAFDYLLVDTSYMATMLALNEANIIQPVKNLKEKEIVTESGQWNQEYLKNRRAISDFIAGMNGYKYYIVGISIVVESDLTFSTSHLMQNHEDIYQSILQLNQERLKKGMVMMNPIHVEGGKSTLSSDYVVPAVRAIVDSKRNIIGYVVLYFDYGIIDTMFSSNLPEGSYFQVVNENQMLIFSNCGEEVLDEENPEEGFVYNTFSAKNVEWKFTMALPSNYYIADLNHTAYVTGVLMIIVLLLAEFLSVLMISRVTAEISKLRQKMQLVSGGNLDVRYEVRSRDEIGQMGNTFNHMLTRIRELMRQVTEKEEQKRLVEIAFLEAQINPHFISNVLNNVVWMARIQHADNIVPLVQSLNAMLQNVMHQERDMIPLKDELNYVENYLRIMEISGSYDFVVEKNIQKGTEDLLVLRFILQPILENAICHGLPAGLAREGKIIIRSQLCNGKLVLTIEDNGDGMSEEQIECILAEKVNRHRHFNGIGIPNVRERIRLFFGDEYGLHYESRLGKYTRAVFELPILADGEEMLCQK